MTVFTRGGDDGTSLDLAVVLELAGLVGAFQGEVLDQHPDLLLLGEGDHMQRVITYMSSGMEPQ